MPFPPVRGKAGNLKIITKKKKKPAAKKPAVRKESYVPKKKATPTKPKKPAFPKGGGGYMPPPKKKRSKPGAKAQTPHKRSKPYEPKAKAKKKSSMTLGKAININISNMIKSSIGRAKDTVSGEGARRKKRAKIGSGSPKLPGKQAEAKAHAKKGAKKKGPRTIPAGSRPTPMSSKSRGPLKGILEKGVISGGIKNLVQKISRGAVRNNPPFMIRGATGAAGVKAGAKIGKTIKKKIAPKKSTKKRKKSKTIASGRTYSR